MGSGVDTTDVTTAIGGGADSANGLYSVTGDFAVSQCALSATYGFGPGFMARVCVPFYTILVVVWNYAGNRASFAGAAMSTVFDFEREARELFDLNVTGWSKTGVGDIAL